MLEFIAAQPHIFRRTLLALIDSVAIIVSIWAAFAIRLGDWWSSYLQNALELFPLAVLISIPVFIWLGLYRSIVLYAGRDVLYTIIKCISLSLLIIISCWVLWQGSTVPRSTWLIYWFVLLTMIGGSRLLLRDYLRRWSSRQSKRVIIYGAGMAGVQLVTALQQSSEFTPVAFIDDDRKLQSSNIFGLRVYSPEQASALVRKKHVTSILVALPAAPQWRKREILDALAALPAQILIMPNLNELASGQRKIDELREVEIEDLLEREPIPSDSALLSANIRAKVVMVTGAGGSIGTELCRQILNQQPRCLILFELSEYALYNIERELRNMASKQSLSVEIIPVLGSINDSNRIQIVFQTFKIDTVYHAAAYKHVSIVEHNPIEGVRNNVLGTYYCAQAALAANIETFVLVSTDKAVRPTNVMGASKRLAELVLQAITQHYTTRTRFCMVRFGNVLASSGSVVPLFREQIRLGGPVTVTDPEAVRYFMTIPEAAQLVIQAGSLAEGGDVFLLDMGVPVNIAKLAQRMIELSGFDVRSANNPDGDIEIQFTGLRPGEKLCEELLIGNQHMATSHTGIKRAQEEHLPWSEIENYLQRLEQACAVFDYYAVRQVLVEAVQGYQPNSKVKDWLLHTHSDNAA